MIASVRGVLLEKDAGACVIEAGGVGYRVSVSTQTAHALPEPGEAIFLLVTQVVREDAHLLFGFANAEERRLFELLLTVSGVGPKVAIAVLSGLPPSALAKAIRDENVAALVGIPGVGRKTAERLIVDLRDKLDIITTASAARGVEERPGVMPRAERFEDAVAALVRLGYSQPQAQEAIRKAAESEDDLSLENLVRRALGRLSKATAGAR